MRSALTHALVVAAVLVSAPRAHAVTVITDYEAVVTSVFNGSGDPRLLDGFVAIGDRVRGSFAYETNADPSSVTSVNVYSYEFEQFALSVTIEDNMLPPIPRGEIVFGPYVLPYDSGWYHVGVSTDFQGLGAHSLFVTATARPPVEGFWPGAPLTQVSASLSLVDEDGTALNGVDLPAAGVTLGDFERRKLVIAGSRRLSEGPLWRFDAEMSHLRVRGLDPIPEPASGAVFLVGALLVAWFVNRSRPGPGRLARPSALPSTRAAPRPRRAGAARRRPRPRRRRAARGRRAPR